ncbi:MAG: hypothetical protein AB1898_16585 [Acidobacteriota bacterium]
MRIVYQLTLLWISWQGCLQAADPVFPGATWETRTPAQVQLDAGKLDRIRDYLGGRGIIVRHGYQVYTWGDYARAGDIASAAKPFYAHFLLKAVEDGKLAGVDVKLADYEPGLNHLNASLGYKDRHITFRHCANQLSAYGVSEKPGEAFDYNDWQMALFWDTLFLKVYRTSYESVDSQVFGPLLTSPLQCQDAPSMMAFGLEDRPGRIRISPRDFCRFGLLYLHRGRWKERQLIGPTHVALALQNPIALSVPRTTGAPAEVLSGQRSHGSLQLPDNQTDHFGSYSWLWWVNGIRASGQRFWPDAPTDVFACLGHKHGKRGMAVVPGLDLVMSWNDSELDTKSWGNQETESHPLNAVFRLLVEANGTTDPVAGAAPSVGQIVVDPRNPARMVYHGVLENGRPKPVFICGPGDPEDFFYHNMAENLRLLKSRGARSTYITAYLQDFGGGHPGSGGDLDARLDEWEAALNELEQAGIVTVFFFFDDEQRLPPDWEGAVDRIVRRFKHHKLLIWSVAEEYSEGLSKAEARAVANRIRAADDRRHVVGIHQLTGSRFDFNGDSAFQMFLLQSGATSAQEVYRDTLATWNNTAGRTILNTAEIAGHSRQDRSRVRHWNWAAAMAGASMVQVLEMGRAGDPADRNLPEKYADCARLMDFMQGTDFNTMTPQSSLQYGGTQYVLAHSGGSYIAYSSALVGELGLKDLPAGIYDLKWFDAVTGKTVNQKAVGISAGDRLFSRPKGIGSELALWLRKR